MSRNLRVTEHAEADIDRTMSWLGRRSVAGAVAWHMGLSQKIGQIMADPERFAEAAEAHILARPIRQALFKTRRGRVYRVVFLITDEEVVILRVRGPGQARLRQRDLPDE